MKNEKTTDFPSSHDVTQVEPCGLQRRLLLRGMGSVPLMALIGGCGGGEVTEAGDNEPVVSDATDADAVDVDTRIADVSGDERAAQAQTEMKAQAGAARRFVHPGLLHTEADFKRMREKVASGAQPWADGWKTLTNSGRSQLGYTPSPLETVIRGGAGHNCGRMIIEMQRAYRLALRWKISGDSAYADSAVRILNAWSSTMKVLSGNADRFLAAGIYGYQWANAAEIMRTYPGWAANDVKRFQGWLLGLFYPLSRRFLSEHNDADITNYWANWDLCSVAAILAIGVFCDRTDLFNEAIDYYKQGRGNGAAAHNVYYLHPGHMGQFQESGRDQGHATLCIALAGSLCEMAWNQGEDLYGYANNRFLAGAEYVAKSNLLDGRGRPLAMPFATYVNKQGTGMGVSPAALPTWRPCWESVYHHYVNRKGLSAPWVGAMIAKVRPECSDDGDQPSFGTLTFARDPVATRLPPSGLAAYISKGQVELSWWGSAQGRSYNVKRAPSVNGPFTTLANVTDPRTYVDAPGKGVWYYVVTAVSDRGESAPSEVARAATFPELLARLPLDAGSGTTAVDTSGRGQNAQLVSGAAWGSGRKPGEKVLALDGKNGHLALPAGVLASTGDFTISLWVYWNAEAADTRIFDFGASDIEYMMLTPRTRQGRMRFAITRTHFWGEQMGIEGPALPTGRWVHVAVTLAGELGRLYMDGREVGRNPHIELNPYQLGATNRNWLGRSQYGGDTFNGRMQDLLICSGALAAAEIQVLAT